MSALWKLLALFALLLMPFGMQSALAAPKMDHSATMPMQHCPEQGPTHDQKNALATCTMVCSAALPAREAGHDGPSLIVCAPTEAEVARQLNGLHPNPATPPPKRS